MVAEDNDVLGSDDLDDLSAMAEEDDLEAQMAATMAAEGLTDSVEEDDLEAQMAAAMSSELGDGDIDEGDLEAQMAAAMAADGGGDLGMEDDLIGGMDDAFSGGGGGGGGMGGGIDVQPVEFEQLRPSEEGSGRANVDRLMDVNLVMSVELGRKMMQIREILELGPGKIIELDKLAGEPVDLMVNGKMLAKGEVVVVDENFGVRITDLINPKDRVKSL